MTSTAIAKFESIPFHGDKLLAIKQDDKVFTSIRRVCRSIGVAYSTQLRKLKGRDWATVLIMNTVGREGKEREHAMLDLESLPIWLATITPAKVAPEVRAKLALYQREAKHVLADHFLGTTRFNLDLSFDQDDQLSVALAAMLEARTRILAIKREQERQWEAIQATEATAKQALAVADAVEASYSGRTGFKTCLGYSISKGLKIESKDLGVIGRKLGKYCKENGIERQEVDDERFNRVKSYPLEVLDAHEELFRQYDRRKKS